MAAFGDFHLVNGAGWSVYWRIQELEGSGLEVWFADFHGRRVLWRGSQPFAIVPYHRPVLEPKGPRHTYKDGINPQCGGAAFTALQHSAPNSRSPGRIPLSTPPWTPTPWSSTSSRPPTSGRPTWSSPPSSSAAGISTSIAGRSTATATSIRGSPWGSAQSVWQGEGARPPCTSGSIWISTASRATWSRFSSTPITWIREATGGS